MWRPLVTVSSWCNATTPYDTTRHLHIPKEFAKPPKFKKIIKFNFLQIVLFLRFLCCAARNGLTNGRTHTKEIDVGDIWHLGGRGTRRREKRGGWTGRLRDSNKREFEVVHVKRDREGKKVVGVTMAARERVGSNRQRHGVGDTQRHGKCSL